MFHKINRICEKDFMMILFPKKMNATSEIILDQSLWIFLKINHFGILSPSLRRFFFHRTFGALYHLPTYFW